ncbi:4-hydroxyacetophenone monooxygenase [Auriculariales sp. MPI-PUGE-AT-0066]|nr:4-hydroxyacetophenone monooxygenase [Auriculariales sp. MPI-PUGE-AT-0066]
MTSDALYSDVVCIGAGFAGICAGAQLQVQLGVENFTIYERGSTFGGTWFWNQYPGAACDVPAVLYSLSFAPKSDWSSLFCPYPEIFEYLLGVARKYDLERRTKFHTEIKSARWDEEKQRWRLVARNINTGTEFTHECKVLISGAGQFGTPRTMADLGAANCESFEGQVMHSARWDHSIDLHGKRVVIVGNGCTAAQIVPAIADQVDSPHERLGHQGYTRFLARKLPFFQKFFRLYVALYLETRWPHFTNSFLGQLMRSHFQKGATKYICKVAPKEYHKILIPDFPFGCKRRVLDEKGMYTAALHKANVTLHEENIVSFSKDAVHTNQGNTYPADVLILATGFQANDGGLSPSTLRIHGRAGVPLDEHWRKEFGGPAAYQTVAMNGFPNFFMLLGPNSNSGHTSAIMAIENGVNLVLKLSKPILKGRKTTIEVSAVAEHAYHEKVQAKLQDTVFSAGCGAWYARGGHNSSTYPWSQIRLWWNCTFPRWQDWMLA